MMAVSWLVMAACSSGAPASSGNSNQSQPVESGGEIEMERFKSDIERLAGVRFDDVDALNGQLRTHFSSSGQGDLSVERSAERGALGRLEVRNIVLRSNAHQPGRARLTFDVVSPSIEINQELWRDSILYPARPDAPDSRPYWSVQLDRATVYLGLAPDSATLARVTIIQR